MTACSLAPPTADPSSKRAGGYRLRCEGYNLIVGGDILFVPNAQTLLSQKCAALTLASPAIGVESPGSPTAALPSF